MFSIQPIDGTLTGTTTPGQSGPGSNGDEHQTPKTGTSPSDSLTPFPGHVDPQPPPSSTHMIKRVEDCHKGNRVGAINSFRIIQTIEEVFEDLLLHIAFVHSGLLP